MRMGITPRAAPPPRFVSRPRGFPFRQGDGRRAAGRAALSRMRWNVPCSVRIRSFTSEGHHRIDLGGPARGHEACDQGYERQQSGDEAQGHRIVGAGLEEHGLKDARAGKRRRDPEQQAETDQSSTLRQHQPEHIGRPRTQCEADSNSPLRCATL